MTPKAVAVIPWRSGDPHRERAVIYVLRRLEAAGIEVVLSDSPDEKFSRGQAKNLGADEAVSRDADIVIFHDADMVLPEWAYPELVDTAWMTGRLVIGFNEYRPLTQPATAMVLDGRHPDPFTAETGQILVGWSLGGVIALTTEALLEVGGYDERFRGWGCEDFAFAIACRATLGMEERLPNSAVHLWHEHGSATQDYGDEEFNAKLLAFYNQIESAEDLRSVRLQEV